MRYRRLVSISLLVGVSMLLFGVKNAVGEEMVPLSREDTVSLSKPAVVRIAQHVKGTATIPALTINLKERSVNVDTGRPSQTVPIDDVFSGSGFIVSSDGYIVTNSHVISLQTTKMDVVTNVVLPAMYASAFALNEEEAKKVFEDEDANFEFSKKVFEYISEKSTFDVSHDIVVLDPSSRKEHFDELMTEGFPAEIISVNEHFYEDDNDVALIKINQTNLPTLPLADTEALNVGKQVSIFGFPKAAEFNQRNPLESTFTQGVVSAIKDSEKKDFKVFQTDAKVSEGSSGGPLVDDHGKVVGIVTFQTNQLDQSGGDNFAFALPIRLVQTMIVSQGIVLTPSLYQEHLKQGIADLSVKHCIDASHRFALAQEVNPAFEVGRYIAPYSARCALLVANHQSNDTRASRLREWLHSVTPSMWFAFGIIVIFGISLGFVLWWLIREVDKEEKEIHILEQRLKQEEAQIYTDHKIIEGFLKKKK